MKPLVNSAKADPIGTQRAGALPNPGVPMEFERAVIESDATAAD
jgi:hypothetical protein